MNKPIEVFWESFLKETKLENVHLHDAWAFGDTALLADELALMTVKGIKTERRVLTLSMCWPMNLCHIHRSKH
ncbi:hypothetical protein MGH68_08515 [Erysipelothrix sp. D19-032]